MAELVMVQNQSSKLVLLENSMELAQKFLKLALDAIKERIYARTTISMGYTKESIWQAAYEQMSPTASVSSFLPIYLFTKMTVASMQNFVRDSWLTYLSIRHLQMGENIRRWRGLLCAVLDMLETDLHSSQRDRELRMQTLSTTWHIHEWATTHVAENNQDLVIEVIARLLCHFQQSTVNVATPDGKALWAFSATAHVYFHLLESISHVAKNSGGVSIRMLDDHPWDPLTDDLSKMEQWVRHARQSQVCRLYAGIPTVSRPRLLAQGGTYGGRHHRNQGLGAEVRSALPSTLRETVQRRLRQILSSWWNS
ncbi:hypothetical protein P171DRAFT_114711 [Karstenula rhodostoma CBS 690.94]|uniref:Uncharacterized protein n=1 Tax=Karstenula rhodostoma CBS 690.94 TaxID=1392251 RepID=A0A9P4PBE1_9PLEO|nr:hypothetical protein P171DRAFT_114711 [Karstenula rhodostoma CBS 690.94]